MIIIIMILTKSCASKKRFPKERNQKCRALDKVDALQTGGSERPEASAGGIVSFRQNDAKKNHEENINDINDVCWDKNIYDNIKHNC